MKEIIQYLAAIAKLDLPKCKGCGGAGFVSTHDNKQYSCPTCADLRRVAEMHEHEWKEYGKSKTRGWYKICQKCGVELNIANYKELENPTHTIPSLRSYMEIVGVWEEFKDWVTVDDCTSDKFYTVAEEFLKGEVEG